MNLVALPALADNYLWMLHDGQQALVVDPGDAAPVTTALEALGLELAAILVTHHHFDHVGGLPDLLPRLTGPVRGPAGERMPVAVLPMREGDAFDFGPLRFTVLDVPGHTLGHVAYLGRAPGQPPRLFCGDTLFSAGCGRVFEGTPQQLHASLSKFASLPEDTQVCCTHEYTLSNLKFAAAVEPDNADVQAHLQHAQALRARGLPTLPSTLGLERRINPFLRCDQPAVVAQAMAHGASDGSPPAVFAALRAWKNHFQ